MKRPEQLRLLKQILQHIDKGTTVDAGGTRRNPTWVYTDRELAKKEWEGFYRNHPQVIGMSSDLPQADSFIANNDFGT